MRRHASPVNFVVITLLMMCGISLHAQRSLIRTYTVGDGLVMNRVRGFHQDKDGFIWMYTWDGLSRYEGYRFRNYRAGKNLKHSFINDIIELPDGTMYLPLNDSSLAVMRNLEILPEAHMPGDVINSWCRDDEGRIFVGTDHSGICLLENGKLVKPPAPLAVNTILQLILYDDHFYFIGPQIGPSGVYDREFNLVASWYGPGAFCNSIYQDHMDRIFVCTIEGVKEVDVATSSFSLKEVPEIPNDAPWKNWNVSSLIVTPENDMWLGTNQGLVHLRADRTWKVLTVQDGLLSNQVGSLFLDNSNTLWIGTDAGAASMNLQTKIADNRDLPGLYSNFILPVDDGSVYIITGYTFLNRVDKHMNILHSERLAEEGNPLLALHPGGKSILLLNQFTIKELNPEQYPLPQIDLVNPENLYTRNHDKFWITSISGFICANITGPFKLVPDSYNYPTCIASRGEHLIIGTLQAGLFLAKAENDPDSCRIEKLKDLSAWSDDPRIRSLMTSRNGDIWIGTRFKGLVRLSCNDDYSDCNKQTFSISEGLVSNWITSVVEDQYGNIWVGSAAGIDKLIPKNDGYLVFSFSRINGYYANVRYLVTHPDGSLWVGHNEGLARIVDGRIDTIGPPETFITEVTLGGKEYPTFNTPPVSLRYNENSAHFAFSAPDYINSPQLMFTYRLAGSIDTGWSQPVRTHEIFYGNLRPGKFRFEVAAFGWNGERSAPVSYAFEILNPFWKQTWFILLSILVAVFSIITLYRFRISQLHHVQVVRDRIAADLHDEIGSSLTHINILSEIGRQNRIESNGASNLFERIGAEVQVSSEALDDIIWSVKTKRDAIGDIIARMRQYATELFDPAGITFQLNEHVEGIQSFEMEFKRDFYLVYKEILRNILRHAEATSVDINIIVERSRVSMQITDNGKGFDVNAPTDRSGLSNIQARVKKWNGRVNWNTDKEKGTHVSVEMQPG